MDSGFLGWVFGIGVSIGAPLLGRLACHRRDLSWAINALQ